MYPHLHFSCILLVASLINVSSEKPCYNLAGDIITDGDPSISPRQPCDSSAKISHCCSDADFCLSNGACLDNGGDGLFTIQGCTDPDWPPPCRAEFRGCPTRATADYVPIWMCRADSHTSKFCCNNEDARCCVPALEGSTQLFSLPLWGHVWYPGDDPQGGSTGGSGAGSGGEKFDLADKLTITLSLIFGVLGVTVASLQLRHMVRESKAQGKSTNMRDLLGRQLRLWFPLVNQDSIASDGVNGGAIELNNDNGLIPLLSQESSNTSTTEVTQAETDGLPPELP